MATYWEAGAEAGKGEGEVMAKSRGKAKGKAPPASHRMPGGMMMPDSEMGSMHQGMMPHPKPRAKGKSKKGRGK